MMVIGLMSLMIFVDLGTCRGKELCLMKLGGVCVKVGVVIGVKLVVSLIVLFVV